MGVKGLWGLISPVARTVKLESLNDKRLAIDASIWLYQFLTAMRDKEGNRLKNAHLLGFFRRICKLLFYNIKPVFVFDGGAPELKRLTLNERRKKRTGNANNLQKTAEKFLSAQLRLYAIQSNSKTDDVINKKTKKRDEYDLPPISGGIESMIAKDDPRLATEEDLMNFISEFKPEEMDIDSEEFKTLPSETKLEIIGGLRIKSRQTSWVRFQKMNNVQSAMDFSQLQIKHLVERNDLTQKLINVTNNGTDPDSTTPIRIASERDRKYVLVKNKENAGWTMSSIDEHKPNHNNYNQGSDTVEKPVYVDESLENDSVNSFKFELPKSALFTDNHENQEFEDYTSYTSLSDNQNSLLLDKNAYVEDNESTESVIQKFRMLESKPSSSELNELSINHDDISNLFTSGPDAFYALWLSRMSPAFQNEYHDHDDMLHEAIYIWDEDKLEEEKRSVTKKLGKLKESDKQRTDALNFWKRFLEAAFEFRTTTNDHQNKNLSDDIQDPETELSDNSEEQKYKETYMREINNSVQKPAHTIKKLNINFESLVLPINNASSYHTSTSNISLEDKETVAETSDFEEVELPTNFADSNYQSTEDNSLTISSLSSVQTPNTHEIYSYTDINVDDYDNTVNIENETKADALINKDDLVHDLNYTRNSNVTSREYYIEVSSDKDNASKNEIELTECVDENSDEEIPKQLSEEESEFARFLSELKKRDLDSVQKELNTEVRQLNEQRKREKRDSDNVTQAMISECQKLLQLFGIPYITAPMEAEAQCAELLHLELVDGIVTDDSDVFLFGGSRIYKNMFSQKKYVECYFLQDLEQNMKLNREKLIDLAMLLGSDYTEGLSGVGVVSAMEILNEFPGEKGLEHFRDWWLDVQNGTSKPNNNESDFKKKFRKKMKNLVLSKNFPNHRIRDAYLRPHVDDSKIQFQWGMPDLDDLREFLMENFLWSHEKVDETLIPLMKTLVKRQSEKTNQKALDDFFDISIDCSYKPHQSMRIQRIVDSWKDDGKSFNSEKHEKSIDTINIKSSSNSGREKPHKKRKTKN